MQNYNSVDVIVASIRMTAMVRCHEIWIAADPLLFHYFSTADVCSVPSFAELVG